MSLRPNASGYRGRTDGSKLSRPCPLQFGSSKAATQATAFVRTSGFQLSTTDLLETRFCMDNPSLALPRSGLDRNLLTLALMTYTHRKFGPAAFFGDVFSCWEKRSLCWQWRRRGHWCRKPPPQDTAATAIALSSDRRDAPELASVSTLRAGITVIIIPIGFITRNVRTLPSEMLSTAVT
jgi:hypothetical protein